MDALRYYIDGPGEILVTTTDFNIAKPCAQRILCSATCKGVNISGDADMEDVTGGRGLFPKRQFQTGRTAAVEITDCEMDFRYARLTTGEPIQKGSQVVTAFGSDYRFNIPSTAPYEIELEDEPIADTMTVRYIDTGTVVAPGSANGPTLEGKKLTFQEEDAGKLIELFYSFNSGEDTLTVSQKVDSLPKTVQVIHKQPTFDNDNNITGYQYIIFFKMQPSAAFQEDYEERAAYTPQMTFNLVDPQRADKKVMDRIWVKRKVEGTADAGCDSGDIGGEGGTSTGGSEMEEPENP